MDPISSGYLNQGVLGLTIAACIAIIIFLVRQNLNLQKELKEVLLLRLQDSKDYTNSYSQTVEKYATLSEKGVQSDSMMMQAVNGLVSWLQNRSSNV